MVSKKNAKSMDDQTRKAFFVALFCIDYVEISNFRVSKQLKISFPWFRPALYWRKIQATNGALLSLCNHAVILVQKKSIFHNPHAARSSATNILIPRSRRELTQMDIFIGTCLFNVTNHGVGIGGEHNQRRDHDKLVTFRLPAENLFHNAS